MLRLCNASEVEDGTAIVRQEWSSGWRSFSERRAELRMVLRPGAASEVKNGTAIVRRERSRGWLCMGEPRGEAQMVLLVREQRAAGEVEERALTANQEQSRGRRCD